MNKVTLGLVCITATAKEALCIDDVLDCTHKHAVGDWGDVCPGDAKANEDALLCGERLLSVYRDRNNNKFYIITDRNEEGTGNLTTIMLPEDY